MRRCALDIPDANTGGNCFVEAYDNVMADNTLMVCHGVVHGQGALSAIRFPHAWNETHDGMVIDTSNGNNVNMPKAVYYAIGDIEDVIEYDYAQVLENVARTGTYGPWDDSLDFDYEVIGMRRRGAVLDTNHTDAVFRDIGGSLCACDGDVCVTIEYVEGSDGWRWGVYDAYTYNLLDMSKGGLLTDFGTKDTADEALDDFMRKSEFADAFRDMAIESSRRKRAWTQPKVLHDSIERSFMWDLADILHGDYPDVDFDVEDIYFDYGQDWMWTNIVAYPHDGSMSWQVLDPREFEMLVETGDVIAVYNSVVSGKYWPLRDKTASHKKTAGVPQLDWFDDIDGGLQYYDADADEVWCVLYDYITGEDYGVVSDASTGEHIIEVDESGTNGSQRAIYEKLVDAYNARVKNASNKMAEVSDSARSYSNPYQLLSRLQSDCEYVMNGYGGNSERHLWAGNWRDQIETMRYLYDKCERFNGYPEWITMDDIDSYENIFRERFGSHITSNKKTGGHGKFFSECYVADLKHWGHSLDDVEFEINAYADDYEYRIDVWGSGFSDEGYGSSSWQAAEEYGTDIRDVAERALDGIDFYHVTRDDVINRIVNAAPDISDAPPRLDEQTRELIISDVTRYVLDNGLTLHRPYRRYPYPDTYGDSYEDAKRYLNELLDYYGFSDIRDKDDEIDGIIYEVACYIEDSYDERFPRLAASRNRSSKIAREWVTRDDVVRKDSYWNSNWGVLHDSEIIVPPEAQGYCSKAWISDEGDYYKLRILCDGRWKTIGESCGWGYMIDKLNEYFDKCYELENKTATRHFTYAEMKELDDEIEGRELHNSSRLRYTTDCELM